MFDILRARTQLTKVTAKTMMKRVFPCQFTFTKNGSKNFYSAGTAASIAYDTNSGSHIFASALAVSTYIAAARFPSLCPC